MATEKLNINSWDGAWPVGSLANIDEPIASADGSAISTAIGDRTNTIVGFDNVSVISNLDIVTRIDITIRLSGVSAANANVWLLINGSRIGTFNSTGSMGTGFTNYSFNQAAYNTDWSVADLNTLQVEIAPFPSTGFISLDCCDLAGTGTSHK